PLRKRGSLLAAQPSPLRAEVVERDRACELAQPRTWRAAALVEPVPQTQRTLERLGRQVLRDHTVAGEPGEVAVDVVQMTLGRLSEAPARHTPPRARRVTPIVRAARAASRSRPRPAPCCPCPGPRGRPAAPADSDGRGRRPAPRRARPRGCWRAGRG